MMNRIGGDAWRTCGTDSVVECDFIQSNSDEFDAMMTARAGQTNEVTRCAEFLPLLADLDTEIALLDRRRDQRRIATSLS
jgi:hypothetical protein